TSTVRCSWCRRVARFPPRTPKPKRSSPPRGTPCGCCPWVWNATPSTPSPATSHCASTNFRHLPSASGQQRPRRGRRCQRSSASVQSYSSAERRAGIFGPTVDVSEPSERPRLDSASRIPLLNQGARRGERRSLLLYEVCFSTEKDRLRASERAP